MLTIVVLICLGILLLFSIKSPRLFIAWSYFFYFYFYLIVTRLKIIEIGGAIKPIYILFGITLLGIVLAKESARKTSPYILIVMLYFIYNVFCSFRGLPKYGQWSIGEGREYYLSLLFFLYVILKIRDTEDFNYIIKSIILTGLVVSLSAFYIFTTNLILYSQVVRTFAAGKALAMPIGFFLSAYYLREKLRYKYYIIIQSLFIISIIICQHRSVWLGFIGGIVVKFLLEFKRIKQKNVIVSIVFFSIVIGAFFSTLDNSYMRPISEVFSKRLLFASTRYYDDMAGMARLSAWKAEVHKFYSYPIWGSGWGNKEITTEIWGDVTKHVHNGHLTMLSRTGIIGYFLFLLLFLGIIKRNDSNQLISLNISILTMLIFSFFYPILMPIWILLGLAACYSNLNQFKKIKSS